MIRVNYSRNRKKCHKDSKRNLHKRKMVSEKVRGPWPPWPLNGLRRLTTEIHQRARATESRDRVSGSGRSGGVTANGKSASSGRLGSRSCRERAEHKSRHRTRSKVGDIKKETETEKPK